MCHFTETFRRDDGGDEQHMQDLFPVVIEKRVLCAGAAVRAVAQSVTLLELLQEAGCEGTGCT